jgi:hypothetical protein
MTNPFAAKSCTALYAQELAGTSENGPANADEVSKKTNNKAKNNENFLNSSPPYIKTKKLKNYFPKLKISHLLL